MFDLALSSSNSYEDGLDDVCWRITHINLRNEPSAEETDSCVHDGVLINDSTKTCLLDR